MKKQRRLSTMDVQTLLGRVRGNESDRGIARAMDISRTTVKKYRTWFEAEGFVTREPMPGLSEIHERLRAVFGDSNPPQNQSSIASYRDEIERWLEQGLRPRIIYQKLNARPGFTASESAVYRLCQKIKASQPPEVFVRLETAPGAVAQVDFGEVRALFDPGTQTLRRTWVFTMVLAWSRHQYVEFVFDQSLMTWLLCHQHAFEFFQGVPKRIVLDNLKAAIMRAYTQDQDAEVTRAYGECAEHYGFLIDPCLPKHPQHKGKVERGGVHYVQQNLVPMLEPNLSLTEANVQARQWALTKAGLRVHGTTHQVPLTRFAQTEQHALLPLPRTAYDPAVWKQVKLHRDGHVVFEKAFYSAPCRFVGQTLWVRAGLREIRLFSDDFQLIATHARATQPGERLTQLDHLPPDKVRGATLTRERCRAEAQDIGPATTQVIDELLESRPVDRLRTALRVLKLADAYTPARLEAACARGVAFGDASLVTLKRILAEGLDLVTLPLPVPARAESFVFVRPPEELARAVSGGAPWN
jgi:transposase